ncbi:MAG TPA: DUF3883 domain-containing protein [Candidatus Binatia bacterium]|nr:DUF3883 domain-containing protein [Candidatus Binatia bacterium]
MRAGNVTPWSQKLDKLLPDPNRRRLLLQYFEEALSQAERVAPNKWSVHGLYGGLTLVVGKLIVLSTEKGRLWAALDAELLSGRADLANVLQRSASWKWDNENCPEYRLIPSKNGYFDPGENAAQTWPAVRKLLFAFISRSADRVDALPRRSRKVHDPSLVEAIRRDLKEADRDVPITRNRNRTADTKWLDDELTNFVEDKHLAAQGFRTDPAIRKTVERYAVKRARRYYQERGFRVSEHGKPFDLKCQKGRNCVYVEVKGTQSRGDELILTRNEVDFAEKNKMELFVMHSIQVIPNGKRPVVSGGVVRVITPWRPQRAQLRPIAFMCTIPAETQRKV